MLIDVKKAHLNVEVPDDEKVFVLLPSEVGGGVGGSQNIPLVYEFTHAHA